MTTSKCQKLSKKELKDKLTELQYKVTQKDATEPPFNNQYWDNKESGIYVDITTGQPLFSSLDKYKSGTGWPSFTKPIKTNMVVEKTDFKLTFPRQELRSSVGDTHLGHVFSDGPEDKGGKRYCINSASLRFVPVAELAQQGYAEFNTLFE